MVTQSPKGTVKQRVGTRHHTQVGTEYRIVGLYLLFPLQKTEDP